MLYDENWFEKGRNGVSTVVGKPTVRKQISFLCCELFIPAFFTFLRYGFLSLVVRKWFEWKLNACLSWVLETSSLDSFTANKIILQRVINLENSTLDELVDKSRKEIVKTVIKRVKIISGFLVVCRKLGCAFFIGVL